MNCKRLTCTAALALKVRPVGVEFHRESSHQAFKGKQSTSSHRLPPSHGKFRHSLLNLESGSTALLARLSILIFFRERRFVGDICWRFTLTRLRCKHSARTAAHIFQKQLPGVQSGWILQRASSPVRKRVYTHTLVIHGVRPRIHLRLLLIPEEANIDRTFHTQCDGKPCFSPHRHVLAKLRVANSSSITHKFMPKMTAVRLSCLQQVSGWR